MHDSSIIEQVFLQIDHGVAVRAGHFVGSNFIYAEDVQAVVLASHEPRQELWVVSCTALLNVGGEITVLYLVLRVVRAPLVLRAARLLSITTCFDFGWVRHL